MAPCEGGEGTTVILRGDGLGIVEFGADPDEAVATVREARGAPYPDPLEAARIAEDAGAHGITVHLRSDRRHIQDHDVEALGAAVRGKLNLEVAATDQLSLGGDLPVRQVDQQVYGAL